MYKRILVPLDGSKLAETVLPHTELMAKAGDAEVILATVTELIMAHSRTVQIADPTAAIPALEPVVKMPAAVGKMQRQGQRYLDRIARGLKKEGINVRTEVLLGHPAEEISSFAQREDVDLITMASHGRSGPMRWALGSVSDKVIRASHVPVLMVRVPGSTSGIQ